MYFCLFLEKNLNSCSKDKVESLSLKKYFFLTLYASWERWEGSKGRKVKKRLHSWWEKVPSMQMDSLPASAAFAIFILKLNSTSHKNSGKNHFFWKHKPFKQTCLLLPWRLNSLNVIIAFKCQRSWRNKRQNYNNCFPHEKSFSL